MLGCVGIKGTVSRELGWVLLYFNRKLFSRAIVTLHKNFYIIKGIGRYFAVYKRKSSNNFILFYGTLHNQYKKIQRINRPTILDGLHNSRYGKHVRWVYFLSGDILINHICIVGTAESSITVRY